MLAVLSAGVLAMAASPAVAQTDCASGDERSAATAIQMAVQQQPSFEVLVIEGMLSPDLPGRLAEVLKQHPKIAEIHINSGGGDMTAALEAGKIVRASKGVATRIQAGSTCAEACALLFLGGVPRMVDEGGTFALGSLYRADGSATEPEKVNQAVALYTTDILNYLMRVGVSTRLWIDEVERQKAAIREGNQAERTCLTREQLFSYGVAYRNL